MRTNPQKKGDSLEDAVSFIEEAIHSDNPGPFKSIKIGTKVKFDKGMHEIDVLVTKEMPTGAKFVFIIECKNVDHKSVGKNEVIVLNDKVMDYKSKMAAHGIIDVKGIIVGKSFSEPADRKAKQFGIQLIVAEDILDPIRNAPSVKVTFPGDIIYGTYAFSSLDSSVEIFVQDHPIALIPETGNSLNLDQTSFDSFRSKLDELQREFVDWVMENGNETRNYRTKKMITMDLTPSVHIEETVVDRLRVEVFIEVWFGMGEFVYGFDVQGKKKILRQSLEIEPGNKIPVTILSEPGLSWSK